MNYPVDYVDILDPDPKSRDSVVPIEMPKCLMSKPRSPVYLTLTQECVGHITRAREIGEQAVSIGQTGEQAASNDKENDAPNEMGGESNGKKINHRHGKWQAA